MSAFRLPATRIWDMAIGEYQDCRRRATETALRCMGLLLRADIGRPLESLVDLVASYSNPESYAQHFSQPWLRGTVFGARYNRGASGVLIVIALLVKGEN